MTPAVSVITPIFDAAQFLGEAIESVIAQQDFDKWEMLLIDDGSTDKSAAIATGYCARDSRIQLLTHEGGRNRGSSASRNLGIAHAQGELIAFLDADDTWMPGKLRSQVDVLAAHPEAAMIYSAAERWYSWDPLAPESDVVVPAAIPGLGTDTMIPPPELLRAYLSDESVTPCTCTALARREAVWRAQGFEDAFLGLYDDQVFYAKLCLREPVYVQAECHARYRQHDGSCCATARRLNTCDEGRAKFLEWLQAYAPACLA